MKFKANKFKKYIRDISIVIAGIVITFAGSEIISRWSKQREIKEVMGLIRNEMYSNMLSLQKSIKSFQSDSLIFSYMTYQLENNKEIPMDSINLIRQALSSIFISSYKKDAYELLKSSSLMQNVKDKEFLLKIIETYDIIFGMEILMNEYNNYKYRVMVEPFENLTVKQLNVINNEENISEYFSFISNDAKIWNFIISTPEFTSLPLLPLISRINENIKLLDKKYDFTH